jgi:hypothetical protein
MARLGASVLKDIVFNFQRRCATKDPNLDTASVDDRPMTYSLFMISVSLLVNALIKI